MTLIEPWGVKSGLLVPSSAVIDTNGTKPISPYPPAWTVRSGMLVCNKTAEMSNIMWSAPYPPLWTANSGILVCASISTIKNSGAFNSNPNLSKVVMSTAVQNISVHSFEKTALRSVTIPQGCTVSSTSFPTGCVITRK